MAENTPQADDMMYLALRAAVVAFDGLDEDDDRTLARLERDPSQYLEFVDQLVTLGYAVGGYMTRLGRDSLPDLDARSLKRLLRLMRAMRAVMGVAEEQIGEREAAVRQLLPDHGRLGIRNVSVGGHRTSMRLEPVFWDGLTEMARDLHMSRNELIAQVAGAGDPDASLTSKCRSVVARYYREQARA